jgi:outer membrane protein OmpA-like peptidoglycan-associated protein
VPKYLVVLLLAISGPAFGQDTVVMRDTLVQRMFEMEHKPVRAGFELLYGGSWLSGATLDEPIAQVGCDHFDDGGGRAYGLKALAEIPFWGDDSKWTFMPSLHFRLKNPTFDWVQRDSSYDTVSRTLVPFSVRHALEASLFEAGLGAAFDFEPIGRFHLRGGAEFSIGLRNSYEKSLSKVEPGPLLIGGSRDTLIGSDKLTNKLILAPAVTIGASYEVPLSKKLRVQPGVEASYIWLIPNLWHGFELSAALTFLFDLSPRKEMVPVFVKQEVPFRIEKPQPKLTASIKAVAVSRTGDTSKVVSMTVEEVKTRNAYPLLNYIFFEEGAAQFPARYVRYNSPEEAAAQFQGSSERHDIKLMELYRETLNILGDRLKKNSRATVTLIGSTSNSGAERGDVGLAKKRAEAVRDYLLRTWKIEANRIKVEATLTPEKASPVNTPEGQEENRRVEFRVTDERVNDPVIVTNIEHLATPDHIVLQPDYDPPEGVVRTQAAVSAAGLELLSFVGDAETSRAQKVWAPTEEMLAKLHDSLDIDYDVWDINSNHAHAHSSIPLSVVRVTSDRAERVERFSLILFGFDESRVEPRNERSIRRAAEMIPTIPVDRVLIQGFTDETGDPAHNDVLSEERAETVRKRLEQMLAEAKVSTPRALLTEGRGSHDLLYDNRLPEGRFFSRTVNITIERAPR